MSASRESLPPLGASAASGSAPSDRLLRALLQHSQEICLVLRRDGSIAYHSPQLQRALGVAPAELIGRQFLELLHPEDRGPVQARHAALLLDTGRAASVKLEFRLQHQDGSSHWHEATAVNLLQDPAIAGVLISARDIQERHSAELAWRKLEQRYATIADFAPGFIQEFDIRPDGSTDLRWAGVGFERLIGLSWQEARALGGWQVFCHPEERAALAERHALLRRGEQTEADCRIVNARGEERWLHVINRPVSPPGSPTVTVVGVAQEVTARKLAERRLTETKEQLRLALEHAPIGIALTRLDGRPVRVNRKLCELLDYSAQELLALRSLAEVTPGEDTQRFQQLTEDLLAGKRLSFELDTGYLRRDGREIQCRMTVALVPDANGAPLYFLRQVEDMSAQRSTEAALRTSEALLRAVTDNVPDRLLLLDLRLGIQFANRALPGIATTDLVGRSLLDLLPEADHESVREVYERAIASRAPQVYEMRQVSAGETRWFENRVGPVVQDGRIVGLTVASTEVTARRRADEALRTQARILDAMREGVVVLDSVGVIRMVNRSMARLTGYEPRELVCRSDNVLGRRGLADPREHDGQAPTQVAAGAFHEFEFECVRKDGSTFAASCVLTPIEIGGELHRLAVIENITERRQLEHEIIEIANREQRRIGSDLHDGLGQELTGVALMLRSLAGRLRKEGSPATGDAEELVALVNSAIESTRSLARGLSPVSIERGGLPFALRALTARASSMYGVNVRLRSKIWPQLTLDAAASNHLYRIAQEAVTNAVKHGHASRIVIDLQATGENVNLVIQDDGSGLAPGAALAQGMGLKIMHYRANMVGGAILVEPGRDGGTRVLCSCRQPPPPEPVALRGGGADRPDSGL